MQEWRGQKMKYVDRCSRGGIEILETLLNFVIHAVTSSHQKKSFWVKITRKYHYFMKVLYT